MPFSAFEIAQLCHQFSKEYRQSSAVYSLLVNQVKEVIRSKGAQYQFAKSLPNPNTAIVQQAIANLREFKYIP